MLLIALTIILIYMNYRIKLKRTYAGVCAFTTYTVCLFAINELLSAGHQLTGQNLQRIYILSCGLLLANWIRMVYKRRKLRDSMHLTDLLSAFRDQDLAFYCILLTFFLFSGCMVTMAVHTVPFNWDSMTYHLPRVFHWAQNASVAHYATHISRQNSSPVLDEFVLLHIYLLSGENDSFLNLVQCISFLLNGVLVYKIAEKLHLPRPWRIFSSVLFFSSPIAFMESVTTQNDLFACFWALAFVWLILDFYSPQHKLQWDRATIGKVIVLGVQVALGYLAKPNVCIVMAFFVLGLLIVCIHRKDHLGTILRLLPLSVMPMILMLTPELLRNYASYHAISASEAGARQLVGSLKPNYLLVNLLKDYTYNLPIEHIPHLSDLLYRGVVKIAALLHVDLNDPAIAEDGTVFFIPTDMQLNCDMAINPLVFWLLPICVFCMILFHRKVWKKFDYEARLYWGISVFSLLTFCGILRWEPFITRYMIVFIGVACPAIALVLQYCGPKKWGQYALRGVLYLLCLHSFVTLFPANRNMMCTTSDASRNQGYFAFHTDLTDSYQFWCDYIADQEMTEVGLVCGINDYEFPLNRMLTDVTRMEHVNVANSSETYEDTNFHPEVIIRIGSMDENRIQCHGMDYVKVAETECVTNTTCGALYIRD